MDVKGTRLWREDQSYDIILLWLMVEGVTLITAVVLLFPRNSCDIRPEMPRGNSDISR